MSEFIELVKAARADPETEPWTLHDPAYRYHSIFCGICANDGWPLQSAYRPHTLDVDCWCTRAAGSKGNCMVAIEFGFAKPVAVKAPANIPGLEGSTWSVSFITDDELIETYRAAVEDLRDEARIAARQINAYREWSA